MTKTILALLLLGLSISAFANPQVFHTGRHYYNIYPYHELSAKMKRESMKHARDYIINNIKELIGDADVMEKPIEFVTKNKKNLEQIGLDAAYYLQDSPPFVSWFDLIPSAFVFSFGTSVTPLSELQTRFRVNIGGSFTIGFVIQPVWVEQFDVTDIDNVNSFLSFNGSVVLIGVGDVKPNTGIEASKLKMPSMRFGGGIIWGEMNHPSEFNGITAGVSGIRGASTGKGGVQYKGCFVQSTSGPNFLYTSAAWVPGAGPIVPHANIGGVIPLIQFSGVVDKATGKFLTRKEVDALEKELYGK